MSLIMHLTTKNSVPGAPSREKSHEKNLRMTCKPTYFCRLPSSTQDIPWLSNQSFKLISGMRLFFPTFFSSSIQIPRKGSSISTEIYRLHWLCNQIYKMLFFIFKICSNLEKINATRCVEMTAVQKQIRGHLLQTATHMAAKCLFLLEAVSFWESDFLTRK